MAKQHGAERHFLRPDRVYRTGVIEPSVGYQPVEAAQAVAARFVAPMGLAGPVAQHHFLAGDDGSIPSKWNALVARVKARWSARRIAWQTRHMQVPTAPGAPAVTLDTSPRPPSNDASAIAVQGGWAPSPQTPASAVAWVSAAGDPPMAGPGATAAMMTPESTWPSAYWRDVISQDLPPIVAARGGDDALYKWFRRGRS